MPGIMKQNRSMKTDQELRKNFSISVEGGVIHHVIHRMEDSPQEGTRAAELELEAMHALLDAESYKEHVILINLLEVGADIRHMSAGARKIYKEFMQEPRVKRVALVGNNIFLKVMASFLARAGGIADHAKWFTSKEEALVWLKEDKE